MFVCLGVFFGGGEGFKELKMLSLRAMAVVPILMEQ